MAITDYASLNDALKAWTTSSELDPQLDTFIQGAEIIFNDKLRTLQMMTSVLLATSQRTFPLPADWLETVSLTNTSEQPLSAIIVDYPNATFGVNTLESGKTFQYTIKPVDSGVLKIQFTDAVGKTHNVSGPAVKKGQEGAIAIRINQDSASAASALQ